MNLRSKTFSAGRWTTASAILRSGLQILQVVILARLLLPADFGLMAVAGAVIAVVFLFSDLGLSRALVHFALPPAAVLSTLYWINVGVSVVLMLGLMLAAPVLASAYQEPALTPVLFLTSLAFPFSALGQQFRVLAEKELRFAMLAIVETTAAILGFIAAVASAWIGWGVYALVAGILVTSLSSSVLAWWRLSAGHIPIPSWHLTDTKPFLRFGGYLLGERLSNTLRMQADVFIGGLLMGPAAIGIYSLPRDLSLRIANTIVNPVITRIGFPLMAQLYHDDLALKRVYLQTLQMTSSVNFPIYVALAIFAEEAVALMFGPQWESAAFYARVFAVWGMIRSVGNPIGSLLHAAGRVRRGLFWNLLLLGLVPPLLLLGARSNGLEGLAWAMLLTQFAIFLPAWRFMVFPLCGARLREYLAVLLPPLWISFVAGMLALSVGHFVEHPSLRLILGVAIGASTYLLLSIYGNRTWVSAMSEFFRIQVPVGKKHR